MMAPRLEGTLHRLEETNQLAHLLLRSESPCSCDRPAPHSSVSLLTKLRSCACTVNFAASNASTAAPPADCRTFVTRAIRSSISASAGSAIVVVEHARWGCRLMSSAKRGDEQECHFRVDSLDGERLSSRVRRTGRHGKPHGAVAAASSVAACTSAHATDAFAGFPSTCAHTQPSGHTAPASHSLRSRGRRC